MAVTTKKLFPATSNATTTVFSPVGIQLNNQDDLDVYVTLSGGTRVLQLRQSTGSTAQSSHPQVNNTDGLYFPAVTAGTTLYNYTLSTDNNTITFNSALPQGAVVFCERRTRDADSTYTTFASGSTIRATDLNNSSTESNFTAQDGRNKALTIEGVLFRGDQPSTNFVTSDHIVNGTIVTTDIANDSVNADKIPDDTINSEHYVAQSIDTEHIALENITTALIAGDAIVGSKIADNAVDSEHYTDGSIDREHLAADIVDGTKIDDDSIDSEHYVDLSIDTQHIGNLQITTDKIADGAITDAKIQGGSLDNRYYTKTQSDARYFNISTGDTIKDGDTFPDNDTTIATTAAINDRIIDLVDDVGGFVPIANETSFPTANPDVNNGSGTLVSIKSISSTRTPSSGTVTIANGAGSGNTVSITGCGSTVLTAGFGVIVETTSTLHTYAFHRLVPKATEVTTVAGISSDVTKVANIDSNVTSVANIDSNVTTVAGIASDVTAVAGNATNITAVKNNETNINAVKNNETNINTVAADGTDIGLVAGSITSVNTAASNIGSIANFGDQYQVASSAPSTDGGGNALAAGDLYFDTTSNELRVHNGTTFQGGVTATGNLAGTGANTFTGNQTIQNTTPKLIFSDTNNNPDYEISSVDGAFRITDTTNSATKLKINTDGHIDLEGNVDVSSGLDVTGNITVSGNVDGRDVAADGNKLDGIASSSTANPNAIDNVVEDTTPQLGGNLDTNGSYIFTSQSNGNIPLQPNGTGSVEIKGAGGNDGTLQLNCSANSHGVKIKSPPHSAAQSYTLTLPSSLTNNGVLTTTSSGGLSAGLLTNANVASNAAIAGTKISPDFGSQAVTTTNDLGSGDHTITGAQPKLLLQDSNNNPDWSIKNANGNLAIQDETASATRFSINSSNGVEFHMHAVPAADSTHDLGLNGTRWRNVYADTYYGNGANLTGINTDLVSDTSPQLGGDLATNGNNIRFGDSSDGSSDDVLSFGASNDLLIYHYSDSSYIQDNGTGPLQVYTNGTDIRFKTSDGEVMAKMIKDGAVELYNNGSKKLETTSVGNRLYGRTDIGDSTGGSTDDRLAFGDSQDLQIYHDGSHSYIDNNTGSLRIRDAGGAEKLRVAGTGVTVTGNITVTGTVDGIDIATDVAANTAKVTNATHTGEVTGATSLTIADNVVDEANLKVSNSPVNGYMLTAQSGNTGGLTWAPAAAGAKGGGNDSIFWENGTNVTTDYTITNGKNAGSFGPITIDSGVTVTVGSGETWTVV